MRPGSLVIADQPDCLHPLRRMRSGRRPPAGTRSPQPPYDMFHSSKANVISQRVKPCDMRHRSASRLCPPADRLGQPENELVETAVDVDRQTESARFL